MDHHVSGYGEYDCWNGSISSNELKWKFVRLLDGSHAGCRIHRVAFERLTPIFPHSYSQAPQSAVLPVINIVGGYGGFHGGHRSRNATVRRSVRCPRQLFASRERALQRVCRPSETRSYKYEPRI